MARKKLLTLVGSICLILIVASLSLMTACKPATPEEKTLQIGGLWALSGWASANDVKSVQAAQIAVDMFNERGGLTINGQKYKVELVVEDVKSTAEGAAAAANRLVYDKGIKFIAGGLAFMTAGAGTVTEPAQVLRCTFYNVGSPGELGPDVPYTFSSTCNLGGAIAGIEYLKQAYPDVKNVVEIEPVGAFSPDFGLQVRNVFQQAGISLVGDVLTYPDEIVDFAPFIAKITSLDPDALFSASGMPHHSGAILKGIREAGWNKLYAMGCPMSAVELVAISGKDTATNTFTLCDVEGAPGTPPVLAEFQSRTRAELDDVSLMLGYGANCVWTLLSAIQAAQSLDPTVVKDTWENLDTIDTLYGTGWMGGQETYGIKHQVGYKMPVQVIENGEGKFGDWIEVRIP
ncbi:MAG TPA: ABC transporter substrate-binding protein [Dehalococcoidia bacterium]|nr:ABC transporter substrate-binding protein [Dehalococcoidia bacterium]